MRKPLLAAATAALLLSTSACVTDPDTGQQKMSRGGKGALAGAAGGALLGGLIGDRTGAIIGAGIGALAGGGVGVYMDDQEKKLRAAAANTGVDVNRVGDEIRLSLPDNVTFDTGKADLKPGFPEALDGVARTLAQYNKTYVDVMGHTDSTGSDAFNQTLSQKRAEAVANYLIGKGVVRERMGVQGFGPSQPVADNATPEGRAKNRRVEIRLVPITSENTPGAKVG